MGDPTVQSLASDLQALRQTMDDFIRLSGRDIGRLGELIGNFGPRIKSLEGGSFEGDRPFGRDDVELAINPDEDYESVAMQGDLRVHGELTVDFAVHARRTLAVGQKITAATIETDSLTVGSALQTPRLSGANGHIDVDAAQLRIHGADIILDARSNALDSSRPYRAMVDSGNELIINFNNDYGRGVVIDSTLTVVDGMRLGGANNPGSLQLLDEGGKDAITFFGKDGKIYAGTVFANLRPPGGDCAEEFDVVGDVAAEPGTVMVVGPRGLLEPCSRPNDTRVVGVVSNAGALNTGLVLNEKAGGNRAAIALVGTVYCKCDASDAAILVGDLLTTSSMPGHAMRIDSERAKVGTIVGKALRDLPEATGLIPILVGLR